jgi:putative oxidoreductase
MAYKDEVCAQKAGVLIPLYDAQITLADAWWRPQPAYGDLAMEKAKVIKAAKIIGMWIPAILLVFIFAPQGWSKFNDASGWATAFRHWGYPDWFRVAIGVMEVGAVVLLLLGRTAAFGAIVIIVVMLGGMATHIVFDGGRHLTSEVVPLVLASIVLAVRRSQIGDMVGRMRQARA